MERSLLLAGKVRMNAKNADGSGNYRKGVPPGYPAECDCFLEMRANREIALQKAVDAVSLPGILLGHRWISSGDEAAFCRNDRHSRVHLKSRRAARAHVRAQPLHYWSGSVRCSEGGPVRRYGRRALSIWPMIPDCGGRRARRTSPRSASILSPPNHCRPT